MPFVHGSLVRGSSFVGKPNNALRGAVIGMPFCLAFWAVLMVVAL